MPQVDPSRRAVELASAAILRARSIVAARLPYGPNKVAFSPAEARRRLSKMSDEARARLSQRLGPDEWEELLRRVYGPR